MGQRIKTITIKMCENNDDYLQRVMREAQELQARLRAEQETKDAEAAVLKQKLKDASERANMIGERYDRVKKDLSTCVDKSAIQFAQQLGCSGPPSQFVFQGMGKLRENILKTKQTAYEQRQASAAAAAS